ncbi:hypothetical protein H0G86_006279 [Trichoderma simmonsii]|uniref:Uncharacterized protein n=1 Tax=Trichoderma simmonsii TaxID=1491479 RepID=A0A8G0LGC6_9HYPO|nr:hypothetical protein H0G86_006279 [Trichoderma simmonsii]
MLLALLLNTWIIRFVETTRAYDCSSAPLTAAIQPTPVMYPKLAMGLYSLQPMSQHVSYTAAPALSRQYPQHDLGILSYQSRITIATQRQLASIKASIYHMHSAPLSSFFEGPVSSLQWRVSVGGSQ